MWLPWEYGKQRQRLSARCAVHGGSKRPLLQKRLPRQAGDPRVGSKREDLSGYRQRGAVKGAGHFTNTSIWDGNVAIAGHNRGVNNHFGKIHTLNVGDTIKLMTKLGERSYEVYSVAKIGADDTSVLNDSAENIITLVTCVMNQPDYRWCVQARQK